MQPAWDAAWVCYTGHHAVYRLTLVDITGTSHGVHSHGHPMHASYEQQTHARSERAEDLRSKGKGPKGLHGGAPGSAPGTVCSGHGLAICFEAAAMPSLTKFSVPYREGTEVDP